MVKTSFSDANILNIFSGGSLLPGHTVTPPPRQTYICVLEIDIENKCLPVGAARHGRIGPIIAKEGRSPATAWREDGQARGGRRREGGQTAQRYKYFTNHISPFS